MQLRICGFLEGNLGGLTAPTGALPTTKGPQLLMECDVRQAPSEKAPASAGTV